MIGLTETQLILERLDRLEAQSRRIKHVSVAVFALAISIVYYGIRSQKRLVESEQIVLKDPNGEKRGELTSVAPEGPGLYLYDNKKLVANLSIFNNIPVLRVKDSATEGSVIVAVPPSGPGLVIYDSKGRLSAQLDAGESGPRLYLEDKNGFSAEIGNHYNPSYARKHGKTIASSIILADKILGTLWRAP